MSEGAFPEIEDAAIVDAPSGVVLWVGGTPRPQPRPRFVGKGVVSTTGRARVWRERVERAARRAVRDLGGAAAVAAMLGPAVRVELEFVLGPRARGDVDNYAKGVLDALMKAGALGGDDRRVTDLRARKVRAAAGQGCMVRVVPAMPRAAAETGAACASPGWLVGG